MKASHQETVSEDLAIQQFIDQLDALQPCAQQQNTARFQKMYPAIERALSRKVSQKEVVSHLEKMDLKLSIGGFRAQLKAEQDRRKECGDVLPCSLCGSLLPHKSHTEKGSSLATAFNNKDLHK
ncbi:hypothetical protein [Herminiimonas contaminans]|uniref:Uncharacterized protein n=1 Tax=Herminiimonas contaminans TaxID=1111140 RepID=A0ABS0EX08_9BURK|nr:hypothetical protein [Herminiimonas contaminans]MBF8178367.1 hypothetical protein [Herminiimonas contaminans]